MERRSHPRPEHGARYSRLRGEVEVPAALWTALQWLLGGIAWLGCRSARWAVRLRRSDAGREHPVR
jgi:hypothetical protein